MPAAEDDDRIRMLSVQMQKQEERYLTEIMQLNMELDSVVEKAHFGLREAFEQISRLKARLDRRTTGRCADSATQTSPKAGPRPDWNEEEAVWEATMASRATARLQDVSSDAPCERHAPDAGPSVALKETRLGTEIPGRSLLVPQGLANPRSKSENAVANSLRDDSRDVGARSQSEYVNRDRLQGDPRSDLRPRSGVEFARMLVQGGVEAMHEERPEGLPRNHADVRKIARYDEAEQQNSPQKGESARKDARGETSMRDSWRERPSERGLAPKVKLGEDCPERKNSDMPATKSAEWNHEDGASISSGSDRFRHPKTEESAIPLMEMSTLQYHFDTTPRSALPRILSPTRVLSNASPTHTNGFTLSSSSPPRVTANVSPPGIDGRAFSPSPPMACGIVSSNHPSLGAIRLASPVRLVSPPSSLRSQRTSPCRPNGIVSSPPSSLHVNRLGSPPRAQGSVASPASATRASRPPSPPRPTGAAFSPPSISCASGMASSHAPPLRANRLPSPPRTSGGLSPPPSLHANRLSPPCSRSGASSPSSIHDNSAVSPPLRARAVSATCFLNGPIDAAQRLAPDRRGPVPSTTPHPLSPYSQIPTVFAPVQNVNEMRDSSPLLSVCTASPRQPCAETSASHTVVMPMRRSQPASASDPMVDAEDSYARQRTTTVGTLAAAHVSSSGGGGRGRSGRKAPPQSGLPNTQWNPAVLAFDDRMDQWSPSMRVKPTPVPVVAPNDRTEVPQSPMSPPCSGRNVVLNDSVTQALGGGNDSAMFQDDIPSEWTEFLEQNTPQKTSPQSTISEPKTAPAPRTSLLTPSSPTSPGRQDGVLRRTDDSWRAALHCIDGTFPGTDTLLNQMCQTSSPIHRRQASVDACSSHCSPVHVRQETSLSISPRRDDDERSLRASREDTLLAFRDGLQSTDPTTTALREGVVVGIGWGKTPYVRQPLDDSHAGYVDT